MIELACRVAWANYGQAYRWGGSDTIEGFDCSGLVIEILKSVGILPHKGDWTANELMLRFRTQRVAAPYRGCLVFYGQGRATHVEFCLGTEYSIGASGGGSSTTDEDAAADADAFTKVRPITRRRDILGYADPFLELPEPGASV